MKHCCVKKVFDYTKRTASFLPISAAVFPTDRTKRLSCLSLFAGAVSNTVWTAPYPRR